MNFRVNRKNNFKEPEYEIMRSINDFYDYKSRNLPISMVTCYDFLSARIISQTPIDAVLVGDSAAMVMHGHRTTVNAEIGMMTYHVSAVARGLSGKILIADLPFLEHTKGIRVLMESVDALMKAGANGIKIEGANLSLESIRHLIRADVPVMGHLGLTPQSVNKLGGFKVQGRENGQGIRIKDEAKLLEEAGVFAIVLEMVPADLAGEITENISIPTIGIGAGSRTSGQILVLHDLLGLNLDFNPRFVRHYLEGAKLIQNALVKYDTDIKSREFPSESESY